MNNIITIGRQFGSGGRELGKRLAELLGYAYYDKEIVTEIAKRTQLAESYVRQIVERKPKTVYPITIGHSFQNEGSDYMLRQYAQVYAEQTNVLREMAEKSDCVIVGRCADYILKDHKPFRIFVYASEDYRFERCKERGEAEHEGLTDRQLRKKIRRVDKERAKYYRYYTGQKWGQITNYDLCINLTDITAKESARALAHMLGDR